VKRHPLFTEPVTISIDGLPQGYTATPAVVLADQSTFSVAVMIPEAAAVGEVPNLTLKIQHASGAVISNPVAVKLIVE
jgi:hypothetical protein